MTRLTKRAEEPSEEILSGLRLVARIADFHSVDTGSNPVAPTNINN